MSNLLLFHVFLTLFVSSCVSTAECDRVTGCRSQDPVCYNYECVSTCRSDSDCDSGERCTPCQDSESCQESGDNAASKVCVER